MPHYARQALSEARDRVCEIARETREKIESAAESRRDQVQSSLRTIRSRVNEIATETHSLLDGFRAERLQRRNAGKKTAVRRTAPSRPKTSTGPQAATGPSASQAAPPSRDTQPAPAAAPSREQESVPTIHSVPDPVDQLTNVVEGAVDSTSVVLANVRQSLETLLADIDRERGK